MTEEITNGQAILILEERMFEKMRDADYDWDCCLVSLGSGERLYCDAHVDIGTRENLVATQFSRIAELGRGDHPPVPVCVVSADGAFTMIRHNQPLENQMGYRVAAMGAWVRFVKECVMPADITKGPMGL